MYIHTKLKLTVNRIVGLGIRENLHDENTVSSMKTIIYGIKKRMNI